MAKRRGRPKSEEPRAATVGIRVTPEELDFINSICEQTGKTRHDILMNGVFNSTNDYIENNNMGISLEISNSSEEINIKICKK